MNFYYCIFSVACQRWKISIFSYLKASLTKNAKHAQTVSKRRDTGFGIISDIMQLLETIGDNKRRVRVGLQLRQAWFLNALLVNLEVWHNVMKKDIEIITQLDNYLMRKILNSHSKAPIEFLYLETGTIPVEFVIKSRRVNYLHNIIKRDNKELVKRVYNVQKENPSKGDWSTMVREDMEGIGLRIDEQQIRQMSKNQFKKVVRNLVEKAAFRYLQEQKSRHTKVKNIEYNELKLQPYLESEEAAVLMNIRGQCINGVKMCFKTTFENDKYCKLGCQTDDNIEHIFVCEKLKHLKGSSFKAAFKSVNEQKEAVAAFMLRMATRTGFLEADHTSTPGTLGGAGGTIIPLCE